MAYYSVFGGQVSSGMILNGDGIYWDYMCVTSGGTAAYTTVNFCGYLDVSSGGTAAYTTLNSGGYMIVSSGGTAYSVMSVSRGGTAAYTSVIDGILLVPGGTVSNTTMSGGELDVYLGGTANRTTVVSGGGLYVGYGATALDIVENGGWVWIDGGVNVTFASNSFSGLVLDDLRFATVHSGTTANNTTVNYGGIGVFSGGKANGVTVNSLGGLYVGSGGTATGIAASDGAYLGITVAPNTYIQGTCAGSAFEMKDAMISGYTVISGRLDVSSLLDSALNSLAGLHVASGGTATDTIVKYGASLDVASGGTANSTTVNNGGRLYVSNGGKVTGRLTIGYEATVWSEPGSIIDFNISGRGAGPSILVNDLSLIQGMPDYTITVSATQAPGVYILAGGASRFTGTLPICTNEECFGTLTVNYDGVKYGKLTYTLATADDSLILTVTKEPDVLLVNGRVIRYDGSLDVHTGSGTQNAGFLDPSNWNLLAGGAFGGGANGLLWQENATGNVYIQNDAEDISDLTAKSNLLGTVADGYEIVGIGDFFGTGLDGALLLTPAFGDSSVSLNYGLAVWARESNGTTQNGWLGALVNTWDEVDGMNQLKGDFAGLSGTERNQVINANNYRYELLGTADFNGDGKTDVMLRNNMPTTVSGETITGSGDVFIFLTDSHDNVLTGNRPAEGICYAGCAAGGWNVVGFGDFNGDGTDDALLSDGSNLAGWQIQSGQRIGDYWFGPLGDWQFAGVGDFTGDGTADILVSQDNEYAVWKVKNGTITGSIAIA